MNQEYFIVLKDDNYMLNVFLSEKDALLHDLIHCFRIEQNKLLYVKCLDNLTRAKHKNKHLFYFSMSIPY